MINKAKNHKDTIATYGGYLIDFIKHLGERLGNDRLPVNAGYMAYVTLLSLVPLMTVLLSALSIFPSFAATGDKIKSFALENFVPASSEVLSQYLDQFVANAGKMTAVGIVFLFVIALLLISAIDNSLNYIWRVKKKRAMLISFSLYWMVLTLGPVLVGSSIAVSSYIGSLNMLEPHSAQLLVPMVWQVLPTILTGLAFMGLYTFVPNTYVSWKHALVGAICASLLFELSKKIFAYYIVTFPSYELIYGALAAVPILFVWVYLSWVIVLLGAEITACLGEYRLYMKEQRELKLLPQAEAEVQPTSGEKQS